MLGRWLASPTCSIKYEFINDTRWNDCWSIEALRDVNSLVASIALTKSLVVTVIFSPM